MLIGIILLITAFPVVPIIVNMIRHSEKNTQPGIGTQHIAIIGFLIQAVLIGAGIGIIAKASKSNHDIEPTIRK